MSRDTFKIRVAIPEDAPEIARIWLDGVAASSGSSGPSMDEAIAAFSARLDRPLGKSVTWVAEIEGMVIGWQSLQDSGVTQILRVAQSSTYIAKEWQANGAGRKLLYHAQMQASTLGFDTVVGFVKTDNVSSIKLVQSLGWSLIGNLPRLNNRDPEFAYYAYAVPKQICEVSETRITFSIGISGSEAGSDRAAVERDFSGKIQTNPPASCSKPVGCDKPRGGSNRSASRH